MGHPNANIGVTSSLTVSKLTENWHTHVAGMKLTEAGHEMDMKLTQKGQRRHSVDMNRT